jgi:hypothetical protein
LTQGKRHIVPDVEVAVTGYNSDGLDGRPSKVCRVTQFGSVCCLEHFTTRRFKADTAVMSGPTAPFVWRLHDTAPRSALTARCDARAAFGDNASAARGGNVDQLG